MFDISKKENRRQITAATKAKLERRIIADYKKEAERKEKECLISTIFNDWLSCALADRDIEKNTADRYRNDYDKFMANTEFVELDIRHVKEKDVVRFLKNCVNEHEMTSKCYSNLKTLLNGIFKYAKSEREIECISITYTLKDFKLSPKKFKQNVKKDEEQVYLIEEAERMAQYIVENAKSTREWGILLTLLTGLRLGELVSLKYSDWMQDRLGVYRTEVKFKDQKTGKTVYDVREMPKTETSIREIALSESAVQVLRMIKSLNMKIGVDSEYLFYEEKHGRLKSYFFERTLKKICKAMDIPFRSMHKLRKTYTSYLAAHNVDMKVIQKQLGHKNITTTQKYYNFCARDREYITQAINENDPLKKAL